MKNIPIRASGEEMDGRGLEGRRRLLLPKGFQWLALSFICIKSRA